MLLRKFSLVVWKNLLLRKRHWIVTSFEIVIPVVLFILAAVIQSQLGPLDAIGVSTEYFPITNECTIGQYILDYCDGPVLYAPDNDFTTGIMGYVTRTSNGTFFGK